MMSTFFTVTLLFATLLSPARHENVAAARSGEYGAPSPTAIAERLQAEGKALYLEHCKACHGVIGAPTKISRKKYEKIPDFTDATFFAGRSEDSIMVVVKNGAGRDMKALGDKLTVDDRRAVAKYIRTLVRKP